MLKKKNQLLAILPEVAKPFAKEQVQSLSMPQLHELGNKVAVLRDLVHAVGSNEELRKLLADFTSTYSFDKPGKTLFDKLCLGLRV